MSVENLWLIVVFIVLIACCYSFHPRGSLVLCRKISWLGGDCIIAPYVCLKPGIPDMQHCVALCLVFKLCEFTPLKHYFKFDFRGASNETHLNLPSFIKYCVKLKNLHHFDA